MKKKIVYLCLNYMFTDGWAYQDNLLSKYHVKIGYDVTVITSRWQYENSSKKKYVDDKEYINSDGVKIVRIAMKGKEDIDNKFKRYANIEKYIENEKPDIIFVHNFQFLDVIGIIKYMEMYPKTKLYVDNHADYSNSAKSWISKNILHKIIWKYLGKKIEPYVNKFYGVLPARVDILTELYGLPMEKCELLVMGADDELVEMAEQADIKANIRKQYNIADEDFLIVTGGKIDQWKTQIVLLEQAVSRLNSPNVKLLIFGSIISELKEQILSFCNENIQYIGWLSVEDSYKVIAAADLAVYPGRHSTLWEQTVGQGIPMVVKHWKGTHHVDVGGNVEFLYKDTVEEIYSILKNIISDENKYNKMASIAKVKGKKRFSYQTIAQISLQDAGN